MCNLGKCSRGCEIDAGACYYERHPFGAVAHVSSFQHPELPFGFFLRFICSHFQDDIGERVKAPGDGWRVDAGSVYD